MIDRFKLQMLANYFKLLDSKVLDVRCITLSVFFTDAEL